MSFPENSKPEMGRTNREKPVPDAVNSEPSVELSNVDGPIDLSMPRFPNKKKEPRGSNAYFPTGRRKPSSSYDVDINEQPIDYSKKYVESNSLGSVKQNYVPRNSLNKVKIDHREREKGFSRQQESKAYPYGVYAETDLDQPTDYSLRYAEDDTDDDEKQNNAYFNVNEQEDTVKTYCTEGTPYETPFNVSSATSMSDLRLEDAKDGEASRRARKIIQEHLRVKDANKESTPECVEQDEDEKEEETEIMTKESKNITNELVLNSSSTSIEKPVNYYDEGTPGRISRMSSLSSLGCANETRNEDVQPVPGQIEELQVSQISLADTRRQDMENVDNSLAVVDGAINDEEGAICSLEEEKGDARSVDKEGKVVTFGGEDHYAEQTPLMFSRSSSLGSLSGFEQQSIHDDRSSIVSDFSRRTSGVVSPSELPDSPTQTVPPSPRHNQKSGGSDFSSRGAPLRNFSYVKSPRSKLSVFEDNVTAFKEESTPIEFSAATSLSSLTIDDEPKITMDTKEKDYSEEVETGKSFLSKDSVQEASDRADQLKKENESMRDREKARHAKPEEASDCDEDDEDILAACISMGMRNSMYRQSCKKRAEASEDSNRIPTEDSATNLVRYQTSSSLDRLTPDVAPSPKPKNSMEATTVVPFDTVRVYCTEDTPASISPVGSQSNLSALSLLSVSEDIEKDERIRLSEEDDDDNILNDCIRAGMARTLQGTNSFSATVSEYNAPSHEPPTRDFHENDETGDSKISKVEGVPRKNESFSNDATNNQSSSHNVTLKKKSELYLPNLGEARQTFSTSSQNPGSNETSPNHIFSSGLDSLGKLPEDDKTLEDSVRTGMARIVHGANSFPNTAQTTEFNSPSHVLSIKKSQEDDKGLNDSTGSGKARSLQGSNSFPGSAAVTVHHSPHHVPLMKKSELYLSRLVETRQNLSISSGSEKEIKDSSADRSYSPIANSIVVDHDTSGDDDKILDDCIRVGIARTLRGAISFPSTKPHSPRHSSTTKKTRDSSRSSESRQGCSPSKSSPSKSKLHSASFEHDTSGEDERILNECIRAGMARKMHPPNSCPSTALATKLNSPRHLSSIKKCHEDDRILDDSLRLGISKSQHGSSSFPGTPAATKHNSPRHGASRKKSDERSLRSNESRHAFSTSSSSSPKKNNASPRRTSRSNAVVVDHDTSGDDEKILDECIKAGIARTLQGVVSFPSTVTKHHSPRHGVSAKKTESYSQKQNYSATSSSPVKSNEPHFRRTTSNSRSNSVVDHDTSGDDDKILDECIKVGIARTLQGVVSFPSSTLPKLHSPRHSATKKSSEAFLRPTNRGPIDLETLGDDDEILDECIKAGIARTLQGAVSFPNSAPVNHSLGHQPSMLPIPSRSPIKSSGFPVPRTSSPRNCPEEHAQILYNESPTNSDEEAILNRCIQSAMPKGCRSSLGIPKSQALRKTSKISERGTNLNEAASCSATRVTTEVFRTSVTTVLIPLNNDNNRVDECFGDDSSISGDEDGLRIARSMRSGISKASSLPSKYTNYQRDERRTREH